MMRIRPKGAFIDDGLCLFFGKGRGGQDHHGLGKRYSLCDVR